MSDLACRICNSFGVDRGRDQDARELQQYDCPRCGKFSVTASALAVLSDRFFNNPGSNMRLSHQLRKATEAGERITINTSNLEDLLTAPLPTRQQQVVLLLKFIERLLGDDRYGSAILLPARWVQNASSVIENRAAAIIGLPSAKSLPSLLDAAAQEGLIVNRRDGANGTMVSITPAGWERIDPCPTVLPVDNPTPVSVTPSWIDSLEDESLKSLLLETFRAVSAGLLALPMMGARAAFDRAMDLKLEEDLGSFRAKLTALRARNELDARGAEILGQMIDAGSATAHRAWRPAPETVETVMDEVKHVIRDWFARDGAVSAVSAATPPRKPRRL